MYSDTNMVYEGLGNHNNAEGGELADCKKK